MSETDRDALVRVISDLAAEEYGLYEKYRAANPLNAVIHLSIHSAFEDLAYRLRDLI